DSRASDSPTASLRRPLELPRLRLETVDRVGERGAEEAGAPFGNHRALPWRSQLDLDATRRTILLETNDGVHGARETGAELRDRDAGTLTHAVGHLRMVRLEQNLHRAPSCLPC